MPRPSNPPEESARRGPPGAGGPGSLVQGRGRLLSVPPPAGRCRARDRRASGSSLLMVAPSGWGDLIYPDRQDRSLIPTGDPRRSARAVNGHHDDVQARGVKIGAGCVTPRTPEPHPGPALGGRTCPAVGHHAAALRAGRSTGGDHGQWSGPRRTRDEPERAPRSSGAILVRRRLAGSRPDRSPFEPGDVGEPFAPRGAAPPSALLGRLGNCVGWRRE
jgi:hypothetical protein